MSLLFSPLCKICIIEIFGIHVNIRGGNKFYGLKNLLDTLQNDFCNYPNYDPLKTVKKKSHCYRKQLM